MEDEEYRDVWLKLVSSLADLQVNVGLIASVMPRYPEHVQEGFRDKVNEMSRWAQRQMKEVQDFGEFYDE